MAGIRQGYRGFTNVNNRQILCRVPGAQLRMPRNLDVPEPISNQVGDLNYADNVRFPTVSLPMVPMAAWWLASVLQQWFMTRGTATDDVTELTFIDFADNSLDAVGVGMYRMISAKGAGFRVQSSYGDNLGFIASFNGTDVNRAAAITVPASGLTGTPLEYDSVSFGGPLLNTNIIGFTIDFSNNLTPCPEMNGTLRPTEHNAGKPTAQLTLQTNHGGPLGGSVEGSQGALNGVITIHGVNFTFPKLVCLNPDDRDQQASRVVRSYTYRCFANPSGPTSQNTDGPLYIT